MAKSYTPEAEAAKIIKMIGNKVVEENEVMEIVLAEYFSGSLLQYELTLLDSKGIVPIEVGTEMIKLRKPFQTFSQEFIREDSYLNIKKKPMAHSTYIMQEYSTLNNNFTTKSMHFVTRALRFTGYNLSSYTDIGNIQKMYEYDLNKSLSTAECRDITFVRRLSPLRDAFLLFCRQYEPTEQQQFDTVISVVYINKTQIAKNPEHPQIVRIYSFRERDMRFRINFEGGFSQLKIMKTTDSDPDSLFFMAQMVDIGSNRISSVVMSLDLKPFDQMVVENTVWQRGAPIFKSVQFLDIIKEEESDVKASLVLNNLEEESGDSIKYIAFVKEYYGLSICPFPNYQLGNETYRTLACTKQDFQGIALTSINVQGLYQIMPTIGDNKIEEPFFYGISTRPPGIVELDITDLNNVLVNKIYKVNDPYDKYIGTLQIAVNKNYIMHLLYNPDNDRQKIRVFCRESSMFDAAKFEIQLNPDTVVDFFQFPNTFFNIVIFRDERTVNVTALYEHSLIINATNSSLISTFKDRIFEVSLRTRNNYFVLFQNFNVTFVDKYNTQISIVGNGSSSLDIDVFYNCGDRQLNYIVSDLLNGPNYNLTKVDSQNQIEYFKFENEGLRLKQSALFNFSHHCRINFLFPYQRTYETIHPQQRDDDIYDDPTILICVNTDQNQVASYILRTFNHSTIMKTNEIQMPELTIIDVVYDIEDRSIFMLAEQPAYSKDSDQIIRGRYEIHIFIVQNEIIWKRMIPFSKVSNVTQFYYNSLIKRCIFVEYKKEVNDGDFNKQSLELLRVFSLNSSLATIPPGVIGLFRNVSYDKRVIKALLSSEHVLYSMSVDKRIGVYQVNTKIEKIREIYIEDIVNFEVFDNKYFLLYRSDNVIQVFSIEMYIYLQYKMTLPLYKDYENFKFKLALEHNQYFPNLITTYSDKFYSLLMQDSTNATNVVLFIYCLSISQHNSFVMTRDFSQLYGKYSDEDNYVRIILSGNEKQGTTTLGAISSDKIQLYDTIYCNSLTLNPMGRKQLIDRCNEIKLRFNKDGTEDDAVEIIDTVSVRPISLFKYQSQSQQGQNQDQQMNLRVKSQNQGLAITKRLKDNQIVDIHMSNETLETMSPYPLLYEAYMEGQALNFKTECNYIDRYGNQQKCNDAITERSYDVPYYFPIEFVTSARTVVRSFTMGKLFFMLDNLGNVVVNRLPLYNIGLDEVDGQALIKLYQGKQRTMFGCDLNGFADYYHIQNYSKLMNLTELDEKSESYIVFYHCDESIFSKRRMLKVAIVSVKGVSQNSMDDWSQQNEGSLPFEVTNFETGIMVPFKIVDLEVFGLTFKKMSQYGMDMIFYIAFSCNVDQSYQNVLYFHRVDITPEVAFLTITQIGVYGASDAQMNTFKVTKILHIPQSDLIVTILEDYGAQILNLTKLGDNVVYDIPFSEAVLGKIDFLEDQSSFAEQQFHDYGPLQVFSVMLNMPNSLYFISNYGVYIYDFPLDLTSTADILEKISGNKGKLEHSSIRQIRLKFDYFNGEVATNDYGSAFLISKSIGSHQYDVYLVAISFYSAPNSRIFKMINITWNEQCYALNHDSYFEFSPEDQIAVSFICNQYLNIYRVCMRPNVLVEFSHFVDKATDFKDQCVGEYVPGVLQYNLFNLTLHGQNSLSDGEMNQETVTVAFHYKEKNHGHTLIFIMMGLVFVSLLLYLVFYIDQKICSPKQEKEEEAKLFRQRSLSQTISNSHNSVPYRRQNTNNSDFGNINRTQTIDFDQSFSSRHTKELPSILQLDLAQLKNRGMNFQSFESGASLIKRDTIKKGSMHHKNIRQLFEMDFSSIEEQKAKEKMPKVSKLMSMRQPRALADITQLDSDLEAPNFGKPEEQVKIKAAHQSQKLEEHHHPMHSGKTGIQGTDEVSFLTEGTGEGSENRKATIDRWPL